MNKILIILITLFLIACNGHNSKGTERAISKNSDKSSHYDSANLETESLNDPKYDTIQTIHFQDFSVSVAGVFFWNPKSTLDEVQDDTVKIQIEPGLPMHGIKLHFDKSSVVNVSAQYKFETSLTLMNEGPHCDLLDWKHYYSEWNKVAKKKDSTFVFNTQETDEWRSFPNVSVNEIREAVRLHCGNSWAELLNDKSSPYQYPLVVSLSKYYIKLTGTTDKTNKVFEKYLIIEIPLGS